MFGDFNRAEILGNITHDLELRHTNSGTPVCSFRVATNRRYQVEGEWREDTEFHNVVLWGQRAEFFVQRARKGTRLFIEGRLSTRSWDDESGTKHYRTEIVAARMILIDRYEKSEAGPPVEDEDIKNSRVVKKEASSSTVSEKRVDDKKAKETSSTKKKEDEEDEKIDPDDLPF